MTTRESFNPKLRTSERFPESGGLAAVMTFGSVSGGFFEPAVLSDVEATGADGSAGAEAGRTAGFASSGRDVGGGVTEADAGGWAGSFPKTSIMSRSGSFKVKVVMLPMAPTSRTTRTVEG